MAWAVDQTSIGTPVNEGTFGDASMTLTTNVTIAANTWIFLFLTSIGADNVTSITGTGLTWSFTNGFDSGTTMHVCVARAWAPAGLASSTGIVINWSGTGDVQNKSAAGTSFTGGDINSFDSASALATGSSVNFLTNSIATTANDELIVATGMTGNGASSTVVAPSVELFDRANGQGSQQLGFYRVAGAAGGYTIGSTISFSDTWAGISIAMKTQAGEVTPYSKFPLFTGVRS